VTLGAGREEVLADSDAPAHLAQQLERGDAVARLDSRNVGGGTTRERELSLTQASPFTGFTEPSTDLDGIVDMG
jgi:hypothetical protein